MFKIHAQVLILSLTNIWLILVGICVVWGYRNNYQRYKPEVDSNSKWRSQRLTQTINGRSIQNPTAKRRVPPGQSRIIGGRPAAYGEANYQIYLINHLDESDCGGTLVEINGLRFVLTAAHCMWIGKSSVAHLVTAEYLQVRAGTIDYRIWTPTQVDFNVSRLEAHSEFDPRHRNSDIAILFLNKYVAKFEGMSTIAMARPDFDLPEWFTLSGFGVTVTDGEEDGILRVVDVPRFPPEECFKIAPYVTDKHFCIANTDYQVPKGDCFGDSGGPLVGYNWTDLKWYHYGIVSAGVWWQCGKPSFHTRVSKYFDWIYSKVQDHLYNCGSGHPVEDPPSRYPNCKWPYSDPCYRDNSCKIDAAIFPDGNNY